MTKTKDNSRTLFRRFCSQSTITSMKYFYLYPDFASRCYWTLNMLLVLSLAGLLTWLLNNRFNEIPTRITIENQYESLRNLPYPTITICTPNQITKTGFIQLNKTLINGNITGNLDEMVSKLLGFYATLKNVNISQLAEIQTRLDENRYYAPEIMGSLLPQKCDEYLKLCLLQRRKYYKCKGLFRPIMTAYGICCSFNSIYEFKERRNVRIKNFKPHTIRGSEFLEGLTVVVDSDPLNSVPHTLLAAGTNLVLYTDWTEFPTGYESVLVEAGTESYHMIQATYTYSSDEVKALPPAGRDCYFDDEQVLPYFKKYRNSDCEFSCLLKAVEKACHCLTFVVPNLHMTNACNVTNIPCITDVRINMNKWEHTVRCNCLRDCETRQYKVEVTIGNLNALQHIPNNPFAEITFNRSTSIMRFLFPKSVYIKQKQETVLPIIILASNLGGIFGLCLGCSFISILEILFFIYLYMKRYIRTHFAKKNRF